MTRRRDRYQSAFDGNDPGVSAASYDLMLALMLLARYLNNHGLLDAEVTIGVTEKHTFTLAHLIHIAEAARRQSVDPALSVYQRLQQNEESARLMADAMGDDDYIWRIRSDALADTLNDKAVCSRGFVSRARRILAQRAKEAREARENAGGDAQ